MASVTAFNEEERVHALCALDQGKAEAELKQNGEAEEEEEEKPMLNISKAKIKRAEEEEHTRKRSPYPKVPGLPDAYHVFHLGHGGIGKEKHSQAIALAKKHHFTHQANLLGYQCNQKLDFKEDFGSYLNIHTNNIGDTFQEGSFTINSKFMERAVLDYFAELWNIPHPHAPGDPESYWGFCLTMGSTEGNMYGMWNARDYLSGKKIWIDNVTKVVKDRKGVSKELVVPRHAYHSAPKPADNLKAYTPIAFFSEDTHYSLSKTMTMLEIRTFYAEGNEHYHGLCPLEDSSGIWPPEVPSLESGAVNLDSLAVLVEFFASKGHPILICFNYGTTFKGAYDDVASACMKLGPILQKYNLLEREVHYDEDDDSKVDLRTGYWFHVDGALGAAYMPYIEMAFDEGLIEKKGPTFDFRLPMVHSIAMSGHKWIGAPYPCGVFMTRTKYQMLPPTCPQYTGSYDTTFAGSRNGLSPMFLWDYIARTSYKDQVAKAVHLEELAIYAEQCLLDLQSEIEEDLYVERTPLALTIRFKRVSEEVRIKYTLANVDLNGISYSHIFMMDHVTKKLINALIKDLAQPGAFAKDTDKNIAPVTDVAVLAPKKHRIALLPTHGRGFR